MSDRKNNFDFSRQSWPKQPSAERVVGERGRKELPPGTKGGENMKPDRHAEHKQHAFDSFCKKVLKCEACNGYREISRRKKHSIPFSELPEDAMEQLAAYDRYPWEYNTFILGGDVILIENDLLADALNALPQDNRDILLMYWFLEMADREIAERTPNINGFNQYKRRNKGERGETFRRTAQKFSAQYNVSTGSVQKYAIFSKALDVVGQADPELPGKVLSGTFKISHENLVALSKMPPEEIRRIGTRPEDLQHPFTSYSDTRKEFADTDEEPVESMQETLPLIKIPPMHDPDAEIAGLTLTVPSWVSSIERARNNADMNAASTSAKSKLEEALLSLQEKVSEMLSEIREVD